MRKVMLFCFIVCTYSLVSCSKQEPLAQPQTTTLSFSDFFASYQNNSVHVRFTAEHESKVAYYKIYSGTDGHQLCVIGQLPATQNKGPHTYTFLDKYPKGNTVYYMIGYVSRDSSLKFYGDMAEAGPQQ